MYLLPSRIKTKYRPYGQFYNMPRLPMFIHERIRALGHVNIDSFTTYPGCPNGV